MSVFSKIASTVSGNTGTRVEDALGRYTTAMERIATASEKLATDTESVATATEKLVNINAQRLGVAPAKELLVRLESINGEMVIESNTDLAALLAPLPALPAPSEETANESEQCGSTQTTSGKPCKMKKPCRHHS